MKAAHATAVADMEGLSQNERAEYANAKNGQGVRSIDHGCGGEKPTPLRLTVLNRHRAGILEAARSLFGFYLAKLKPCRAIATRDEKLLATSRQHMPRRG